MSERLSLSDLKAKNAEEEANTAIEPQTIEEEAPEAAAEVETELNLGSDAEAEEEETDQTNVEDWMRSDESTAEKKYTGEDIGAAKAKLRAKLENKHQSKVDELEAEIQRLKSNQPVSGNELVRPKREDFEEYDDPEDAYIEAVTDWKIKKNSADHAASQSQTELKAKQLEYQAQVASAVDGHYERALKLSEQAGISPETYQNADLVVRSEIDRVFPNAGDGVTDSLIASLGEGSEKVMYSLGVSNEKRQHLINLLKEDQSGIKAAIYLGSLKSQLAPQKRTSNAPAPAAQVNGDQQQDPHRQFKRKYDKAVKEGDMQTVISVKRAAKKAGANVSNW